MLPPQLRRLAVFAVLAVAFTAAPGRAVDIQADFSLKEIPEDAAYYGVALRTKEQIEIIGKSKAWAKLTSLETVQTVWGLFQFQLAVNESFQPIKKWYDDPANKELIALATDMLSHEMFIYGGANSAEVAELASEIYAAVRYGPVMMQITGKGKGLSQEEMLQASLFHVLVHNLDKIQTPDLVIGFKLSNPKAAENQLKRLEESFKEAIANEPKLKGRLKREKVADGDFLTLAIDGKLIPWENIVAPLKDHEESAGQHAALVKKLSGLRQTLAIGVRKNYMLVSLGGATTAPLTKLGQGKKLADRPELQPLSKFATERITAVSYLSKAFNAHVSANKGDIDGWVQVAEEWLKNSDLAADKKLRMKKDLAELAKDVKDNIPEVGPALTFGFLTSRGSESYDYRWGEHFAVDASKPLPLLDHVGGNPIFAAVGRAKYSPGGYAKLVKWLRAGWYYVDEFAVPQLEADQRDKYQQFMKAAGPLLKSLNETTDKLLLPALADGQVGLVLDAKIKSKQWFIAMPGSDKPLPMFEPAIVLGVSDPSQLEKAFTEYRAVANASITALRKVDPNNVPDFQLPPPQTRQLKSGNMFFYPLPEIGLDKQLQPNAGLSDKVLALSLSQEHTERLLKSTPLKTDALPLTNTKRPLAGAVYFDWAAMMDAAQPWADYAVDVAALQRGDDDKDKAKDVKKQIGEAFDLLRCLRRYTSATYIEGKALVTHGETIWRDVP